MENNSNPPAGTYVVATWIQDAGYSASSCRHIEVTTVGHNGQYKLPEWGSWKSYVRTHVLIWVYLPGFEARPINDLHNAWSITKFQGSSKDYIELVNGYPFFCDAADGSNLNSISLWKAVLADLLARERSVSRPFENEAAAFEGLKMEYAMHIVDPLYRLPPNARVEKAERFLASFLR